MSNLWQQRRKCSQPIQVAHTKLDHSSNFRPFSNYTNILSVMMSLYWMSLYQLFINAKNLPLKKAMIRVFYSSSLSSSLSSPFSLFMLVFILDNLKNNNRELILGPFSLIEKECLPLMILSSLDHQNSTFKIFQHQTLVRFYKT